MTKLKNKKVLITGGGSGIGLLMAEYALEKGADEVILWDISEENLANALRSLSGKGKASGQVVDVSNVKSVKDQAQSLIEEHSAPDILINNAGIVVGKAFIEHSHEDIERTMSINTNALMHVTKAFLPPMKDKGGHIVNIASAAGFVSNPDMSVYAASKWAVVGWSESLRLELERDFKNMHVTTVAPYYIDTGMFAGVTTNLFLPMLNPDKVAKKIIRGIERNRVFVKMPLMVRLTPFLKGILPVRWFDFIAGKIFGVHKTMSTFKGRTKS